ncbi:MAG: hypothetical protein KAJ18_07895 [Candidatus Omnitrophica bacterium]|nr:hypothetical protein [Candidatus Omnitrophota bacterium]
MKKIIICMLIGMFGFVAFSGAEEVKWEEERATHFIIYYKDAPKDFVKEVERSAEDYFDEITRNLGFTRYGGWSFDRRAKIYIYSDKEDYVASSRQAGWSSGAVNVKDKIIRTFPAAHGFFDTTLPHELGHIIFREFVGFHTPLPLWLDEGVAMFQEKAQRWGAHKEVKKVIKNGRFKSLTELSQLRLGRNSSTELVSLFYSEAASIVSYMVKELGEYRFVSFCRRLKEGKTFEQALRSAYSRFSTIKDLNKSWVDFLKRQ